MDLFYAITLAVAIAAGVAAVLTSVLGLVKPDPLLEPNARIWKFLLSHRVTNGALALGVICLGTSVVVHSRWGHGPGTVAPMDLSRLLFEHEAFLTVGAILLVALILAFYRNWRQRLAVRESVGRANRDDS